jgi:uncharacterized membrane protein HdeD (DUF308 family)
MAGTGGKWIALGVPIIAVGVLIWLFLSTGIGAAVTLLGCLPVAVGVVLMISAAVSRRSRAGKPFA